MSLNQLSIQATLRKIHLTTFLFVFLVSIFIGYSVFIARNLLVGIPDEGTHLGISRHFSTSWLIPPDIAETYRYGSITGKPFLYYWINGRVINGLSYFYPQTSNYKRKTALRLVNVFYASLTLLFLFALSKELMKNRWWQLLPVFLMTNTLMFVFLAGGINYDNLTNLCAFAGIYYLVRVLNGKPFFENSLGWLIWMGLGTLVKITVLPLAAVTMCTWVVYIIYKRAEIRFRPVFGWKTISLLVILIVVVGLNGSLYAVNLIKYRSLTPACTMVLTAEQCSQNGVAIRDAKLLLPERLTYRDVLERGYPDPVEWFLDFWISWILGQIFGFLGSRFYTPDLIITFYRLFMIWMIAIAIRFSKKISYTASALIAILIFYTITLLQTNYTAELITGFTHIGIQGRYLFPVIGILYTLIAYCLSSIPNRLLARATAVYSVFLFLWGGPIVSSFIQIPTLFPPYIAREEIIAELTGDVELSQEFTSTCDGTITQLSLALSTAQRQNLQPISIRLMDVATQQVLAEQSIEGKTVKNDTWNTISLAPLSGTLGNMYRLSIRSPESVTGDAVGVWSSRSDVLADGQAILNGQTTGKDLVFQYQCQQSPFAGWFR